MSDFAPTLAATARDGHRVTRKPYPDGLGGVQLSLQQIAQRISEGSKSDKVRGWAGDVLIAAGRPTSVFSQACALLEALRAQTVYAPDPVGTEYMASAEGTLCLRPGLCIRAADCDDLVIALGAACMSVGIPVRVIKQTYGPEDQEHVLVEAQSENGSWFPMDPSTSMPCGTKTPANAEFRMDPTQPSLVGLAAPDVEFIGVGAPLRSGSGRLPRRSVAKPSSGLSPIVVRRNRHSSDCCSACRSGFGQTSTNTAAASNTGNTGAGGGGSSFGPSSAFEQPQADLESQIVSVVGTGDSSLASQNWSSAVTSYQQAGNAGATVVGPEIDLAGAANVTQIYTQQAWELNGSLASIVASSATQTDAENAQQIIQSMISLYTQAIEAGETALDQGNPGQVPPPVTGSPLGASTLLAASAIGGIGALAWHFIAPHVMPRQAIRRRR